MGIREMRFILGNLLIRERKKWEAEWIGDVTQSLSIAGSCLPQAGSLLEPRGWVAPGKLIWQRLGPWGMSVTAGKATRDRGEEGIPSPPAPLSSTHWDWFEAWEQEYLDRVACRVNLPPWWYREVKEGEGGRADRPISQQSNLLLPFFLNQTFYFILRK